MELHPYVTQIQSHLAAAAALGDDRTRQTAAALAAAIEPSMRLAVLAAVSAAADEITVALLDSPGSPAVAVRVDGDDLRVDVRVADPDPEPEPDSDVKAAQPAGEDADTSARITLRLSETLKSAIESAARTDAMSVNTWLVRAAAAALSASRRGPVPSDGRHHGGANAHRITGWING